MSEALQADVFVSYKQEDRPRVGHLVQGLRASGLTVWWDADIPAGSSWRAEIGQRLDAARCVIVVWTDASASAAGEFVHDEASRAKARGVLLPIKLDAVSPPLGFGQIHTLDLAGWTGAIHEPRFQALIGEARAIAHGVPRPRLRRLPYLTNGRIGFGLVSVVLAAAGFFIDSATVPRALCKAPGVRSVCASFGWGGVPTAAEENAWQALPPGDCEALRRFQKAFPNGAFVAEASRRFDNPGSEEIWIPGERKELEITVPKTGRAFATIDMARADGTRRAEEEARRACRPYASGEFRNPRPVLPDDLLSCEHSLDGYRCGGSAVIVCIVEKRSARRLCQ